MGERSKKDVYEKIMQFSTKKPFQLLYIILFMLVLIINLSCAKNIYD